MKSFSRVSLGFSGGCITKIHNFHHFRWKLLQIESDIVHWAVNTWKNSHVYQLISSHGFVIFPLVVRYRTLHVVNPATARWRAQPGVRAHAHETGESMQRQHLPRPKWVMITVITKLIKLTVARVLWPRVIRLRESPQGRPCPDDDQVQSTPSRSFKLPASPSKSPSDWIIQN